MANTIKQAVKFAVGDLEQFNLADLPEMINKDAMSYKIACSCVGTADIYNPAVLHKNRFNHNFQLHLRTLEVDAVADKLEEALSELMEQDGVAIQLVRSYYNVNFKLIANVELGLVVDALKPSILYKTTLEKRNGQKEYIYRFGLDLTF